MAVFTKTIIFKDNRITGPEETSLLHPLPQLWLSAPGRYFFNFLKTPGIEAAHSFQASFPLLLIVRKFFVLFFTII